MPKYVKMLPLRAIHVLKAMMMLERNFTDITSCDIYDWLQEVGVNASLNHVKVMVSYLRDEGLIRAEGMTSATLSVRPKPTGRPILYITEEGRRRYEMALVFQPQLKAA